MNIPKIIEFLTTKPRGAKGHAIGEHLGVTPDSISRTLGRMSERGDIKSSGKYRYRLDATWTLVHTDATVTPPIYRAAETLVAMQVVARARLVNRVAEVA